MLFFRPKLAITISLGDTLCFSRTDSEDEVQRSAAPAPRHGKSLDSHYQKVAYSTIPSGNVDWLVVYLPL